MKQIEFQYFTKGKDDTNASFYCMTNIFALSLENDIRKRISKPSIYFSERKQNKKQKHSFLVILIVL